MRILVFGATGKVGGAVVNEALLRGHQVTAVIRHRKAVKELPEEVIARMGDAKNIDDIVTLSKDQDLVINATRSRSSSEQEVSAITHALLEGLAQTRRRLLVVGGAASLTVPGSGGRKVLDHPFYLPSSLRAVGQASYLQYKLFSQESRFDWVYLCPPAQLLQGERTGKYRLGGDELLIDSNSESRISIPDLAVALMDEAEHPHHRQTRFTVAY